MNNNNLLEIKGLDLAFEDIPILNDINLSVEAGTTHVVMGPNGAGKTTLGKAIMGDPAYTTTKGSVVFDNKDITDLSCDKRSREGVFISYQSPIEIQGITLWSFLRSVAESHPDIKMSSRKFRKHVTGICEQLELDPSYLEREMNVGFSGGEKKKIEMLQLLLLKPKLAILDEADSGLDVDALKAVSKAMEIYSNQMDGTLLIITHNTRILESVDVDKVHVLVDGHITYTSGPELIEDINDHGFAQYITKE